MQSHLDQSHILMSHRILRIALIVVDLFAALTAIAGGVALIAGVIQFPLEWLQSTPFSSYTIPGLILAIIVGGSALVATATMLTGRSVGVIASLAAGFIIAGWTVGEVAMLGYVSWLQPFMFVVGLVTIGLAVWLWMIEFRHTS
jgi:hypothetical protein